MVMAVLLTNNARSTLLSGINALQTEIRLRAGGGNTFPTITAPGQWFPFSIQPFFSARVLPGETLRNLYFESRVVTSPVLNPIIGWKQEYYFFHVRISDLLNDAMKEMFVDPTNAEISASVATANNAPYYEGNGGVQWTRLALQRIAVNYFRDQD